MELLNMVLPAGQFSGETGLLNIILPAGQFSGETGLSNMVLPSGQFSGETGLLNRWYCSLDCSPYPQLSSMCLKDYYYTSPRLNLFFFGLTPHVSGRLYTPPKLLCSLSCIAPQSGPRIVGWCFKPSQPQRITLGLDQGWGLWKHESCGNVDTSPPVTEVM